MAFSFFMFLESWGQLCHRRASDSKPLLYATSSNTSSIQILLGFGNGSLFFEKGVLKRWGQQTNLSLARVLPNLLPYAVLKSQNLWQA
jgi:hypothetical protein